MDIILLALNRSFLTFIFLVLNILGILSAPLTKLDHY